MVAVSKLKWIGYGLFGLSAFFIFESAFEMYYLTAVHGPQMIFFSLTHAAPLPVVLFFFISSFAFYGYLAYAAIVSIAGMFPRFREHRRFVTLVQISGIVLLAHLIALVTYNTWS
jgi:hypothetical protein